MRAARLKRGWLALICVAVGLSALAPAAQGAASDPLFVFTPRPSPGLPPPPPVPPPTSTLEGPCGLGVDSFGDFYVSDYYHDTVDAYDADANYNAKEVSGATGYITQLAAIDPLDGPCGLALDASNHLYVNDYHRAVLRYGALGSFGAGAAITGATTPEATHPTGVAIDLATNDLYVDQRTHVSVFDSSGALIEEIGGASLKDGYGIAYSAYPATQGYLYLPDAATDTIKVYDPATDKDDPIEEVDGSETPKGEFVSLRDASVAVDRVTGEIYVVDDLQPSYTEKPQAIVYVFHPDGTYEGHLKSLITWGMPSGLAVDNSTQPTQGRVYVTSGNSTLGSIYAYGPGAATTAPIALPSSAPAPAGSDAAQAEAPAAPGAGALPPTAQASPSAPAAVGAAPLATSPRRPAKAKRKSKARRRKAHRTHQRRVKAPR
jgi:DNA-binding beta-propeller fold protein YncE